MPQVDKDSPPAKTVIEFHRNSDYDGSSNSQHHTLGSLPGQASPGNHLHDGGTSKLLGEGITISGSKGGNAALASLISALSQVLGFNDSTT